MQIKRLLDDREVFAGDRLFDAQGRSYAFVGYSSGELVVTTEYSRSFRFKPENEGWLKSGFVIIGRIRV